MKGQDFLLWLGGIVIAGMFVYGAYWVAKHVSYALFYEDMVVQTIRDQVKPDALKK